MRAGDPRPSRHSLRRGAMTLATSATLSLATAAGHREQSDAVGGECLRQHEGRAPRRAIQENPGIRQTQDAEVAAFTN